jgi:uncharacterized membrane protein
MQSATPHHPHNHHNSNPGPQALPATGPSIHPLDPGRPGAPAPRLRESASARRMRVRAGLAYAFPFVPALVLLARERRHHWARFHAAQSLIFFTLLLLVQVALFAALVLLGGVVENLPAAAATGLVFYGLYLLTGILGFIFWLRLVADAMSGRSTRFRLLSAWAVRLEETVARLQRLVGQGR